MANIDFYINNFKALCELNEALKTAANKNKVSSQALIMLLALNNGVDLTFFVKEDYMNELIKSGFVKQEEVSFSVTGKGAILAKSLERII